jgi:hypothetical protein
MLANGKAVTLLAVLVGGCVLPREAISPYGKKATVYPVDGGSQTGELIATSADSIWLMQSGNIWSLPKARIKKVNIERHRFTGARTFLWMSISGAVSGSMLAMACHSYESSSDGNGSSSGCLGILPGTVAVFLGIGSIFALSNHYSSNYHLVPTDNSRLQAYSRFPQGLPDTLRWRRAP